MQAPHRPRPRAALLGALVLLVGFAVLARRAASEPEPLPVRIISASISVDGEVVLRASTSDDGRPDADAVWDYLSTALEFHPTDALAATGIDAEAERVTLGWLRGKDTEHLGDPPRLEVDVSYGGLDRPFVLVLERGSAPNTWRVADETIEQRFRYRWIRRGQAAELDDPRRTE